MWGFTVKGRRYLAAFGLGILLMGSLLGVGGAKAVAVIAPARLLPIYSVDTPQKQIALGINCAWDNGDIPDMLRTLEEKQVKATFFILGQWCDKYPDSVRMIAAAGHEIGSHSNSHRGLDTLSQAEIAEEVATGMKKLENLTGKKPLLIRPPSGAYNDLAVQTIYDMGYIPIQWDCDSIDWQGLSAQEIISRIANKAQNGSITLLHSGAAHTAEALPGLIDTLQNAGYELVPVGEMIYHENFGIDVQGRQYHLTEQV